jgi:hypothetical protein
VEGAGRQLVVAPNLANAPATLPAERARQVAAGSVARLDAAAAQIELAPDGWAVLEPCASGRRPG